MKHIFIHDWKKAHVCKFSGNSFTLVGDMKIMNRNIVERRDMSAFTVVIPTIQLAI